MAYATNVKGYSYSSWMQYRSFAVVRTLVDDQLQSAGRYKTQWDGRNQHGTRVASGVYLYSLEFGNFKKTKSMTLLK